MSAVTPLPDGWVRIPRVPRWITRTHNWAAPMSPRARHTALRSHARALANPAFTGIMNSVAAAVRQGEIGSFTSVRFITTPL